MTINPSKQALRQYYRNLRHALSESEKKQASLAVCTRILHLKEYQEAQHIALYHAVNGEINLSTLQEAYNGTQCYYYPVICDNNTLIFVAAHIDTLFHTNRFGIAEPILDKKPIKKPENLDIILLPLLAFDDKGHRLGMGGGFYDKTLAHCNNPPLLIGVAYDCQQALQLDTDAWDIPMHLIITPTHTYRITP